MPSQTRSTLIAVGVLLLFFAVGAYLVVELAAGRDLPGFPTPGSVAVVPVEGPLVPGGTALTALRRYRERESVEGLVLRIESPGGSVGATQSLYREVRAFRRKGRPVVAWIGDVGASGGYYAALAADSIFALPGSITGSIGVIMQLPNVRGTLDKLGMEMGIVKSGPRKDAGSPFRPLEEADREVFQQLVDDAHGQFVDAVAESRALGREEASELADGRVFSGQRAVEMGLVDGIATWSEAVDVAGRMAGLGEDPRLLEPSRREVGLLDVLDGVALSEVETWVEGWLGWSPGQAAAPRLWYLWR